MVITEKLIKKLEDMVGTTRLYGAREYRIKGFSVDDRHVTIRTDKDPVIIKNEKLHDALTGDFGEVETAVAPAPSNMMLVQQAEILTLKNIVMENISKLQGDKGYINQAREINSSVNTMLKMNQQMIDMYREVRKSGGYYE
jgi:hypothetical protein